MLGIIHDIYLYLYTENKMFIIRYTLYSAREMAREENYY